VIINYKKETGGTMETPNNENLENVEDPFGFVKAINFDVIDNLEGEKLAQVIDIVSRIK
tara:strand:+ start:996 stop:1172 length:177 start_codon:yes stop_codon:yes gene_type:complete